jgi:hypothetical protein
MAIRDIVDRTFREFHRYTGDGKPNEPTGAALPIGDPQSGVHSPKKSELREAFGDIGDQFNNAVTNGQQFAEDSEASSLASAASANLAAGFASDAATVSGVNVPLYATRATASGATIPAGVLHLRTAGETVVGDGLGGLYIDVDNGSADTFMSSGDTARMWYRAADVDLARLTGETNRLINNPKRAQKIKLLLTADWQALPTEPTQIAAQRAMMDDIQANHSDTDFALFLGDLVDEPTISGTGAKSSYGFEELVSDIQARIPSIPWSRWLPLAGNHDRDGTGLGVFRNAWSLKTYVSEIGPLWYHADYGNTRFIFMGDMAGSVGGEILDVAIDWFRELMTKSTSMNVILCIHQPPDPTVYPPVSDPNSAAFQYLPARLTDIVAAYDNIVCAMYGHVGGTIENTTLVSTAYGTTWVNLQMGIPTVFNTPGFDILTYSFCELLEGATTFEIKRWNATAGALLGINDVTISTKFPIQLSGDALDYNGRFDRDNSLPYSYGKGTSYVSAVDFRNATAPFAVPGNLFEAHRFIISDDTNDTIPAEAGTGVGFYNPGHTTLTDASGFFRAGVPGYGLAGQLGFQRLVGTNQEDYQAMFVAYGRKSLASGHAMERMFQCRPSTAATAGFWTETGGGFRAGSTATTLNPVTGSAEVAQVLGDGTIRASRASNALGFFRRTGSTGAVFNWYMDTSLVGSVGLDVASTTYNTTSDYRLKPVVEPLITFSLGAEQFAMLDDALLRVMAFRPVRHNWVQALDRWDHGFIAHELQEVAPHAVTGVKDAEEAIGTAIEPANPLHPDAPRETVEGIPEYETPKEWEWTQTGTRPVYQGVDTSKLVADLTAAVQALTLMVLEQEARIAALEA